MLQARVHGCPLRIRTARQTTLIVKILSPRGHRLRKWAPPICPAHSITNFQNTRHRQPRPPFALGQDGLTRVNPLDWIIAETAGGHLRPALRQPAAKALNRVVADFGRSCRVSSAMNIPALGTTSKTRIMAVSMAKVQDLDHLTRPRRVREPIPMDHETFRIPSTRRAQARLCHPVKLPHGIIRT